MERYRTGNVVIFGGGSGLSQLLKGMIQFPWNVTAVVSVADNGGSTGALRREFNISAVGDLTKVMMAMSAKDRNVKELFSYRFDTDSSLGGHSIKNLIMTALLEQHGSYAESIPILCDLLDVKGRLLPLTEDNVELIGTDDTGRDIFGEEQITKARRHIKKLRYNKPVTVSPSVIKAIEEADLIVFSSGSLITSIMPNIIIPEIRDAVARSGARCLYVCNMITQPGETDNFSVSDHIRTLEQYLLPHTIDAVIANTADIPDDAQALARSEGKDGVVLDEDELCKMGVEIIKDKLLTVEEASIRHDSLKTAYLMFSYMMDHQYT
ncbi:gluconeogenesis factor YvcK family protein [Butyrivibrio sp. MC2013]|uniref:gluconeogenesis factor YvcK family protein n=1 Tax=Butyrivibrio sp. MC2013 TaxID=1280686 RepID=UPI0003F5FA9C|nr:gluconeogenesis factor YvcK family protein [Butyrivibrio sp. MC2013]